MVSFSRLEAVAGGMETITISLGAIFRFEAIFIRLEAIASRWVACACFILFPVIWPVVQDHCSYHGYAMLASTVESCALFMLSDLGPGPCDVGVACL